MIAIHRVLLFALVLLVSSFATADSVASLIARLESGETFQVRAKAALELGRTRNERARRPLEQGLGDESPAVRAAAAAALRVLGDERSIAVLRRHRNDQSASVRHQIRSAIAALERKAAERNEQPKVIVKLGEITIAEAGSARMKPRFERESRRKLDGLPGVMVLENSADAAAVSRERRAPVVVVSGRLQKVNASREGSMVVYSARVQYVVHTHPDRTIVGLISGEASARASVQESRDSTKVAELKSEVLSAAVESAVRRAPAALEAAVQ